MIYYIGGFPPPYGGVTVKNELLFSMLEDRLGSKLKKLDTQRAKKNPLLLAYQSVLLLANRKAPLIVATAGTQRRHITLLLNKCNRRVLNKSCLIVMGGHFARRVKDDPGYIRGLARYRCILVETKEMAREMEALGLTNVAVYPNCRRRPATPAKVASNPDQPLRCVFFSLISRDKGADRVLSAARQLPDVQFDFYGVLAPDYAEAFKKELDTLPNGAYHGVFQVKGDNVYRKLNAYDLLLLPTDWPHEGVPGVLVEAKIAAVPAIVSNVCYNSEIVENGVSGTVLAENTAEALAEAIRLYDRNRDTLTKQKEAALRSAEAYFAENYIDEIAGRFHP